MCLQHLKWGMHFLDKLPAIVIAGDLLQFSPSDWHFYLAGTPLYPLCLAQRRGLWVIGCLSTGQIPSHQGVPGGETPAVGDTLNLPLHLPQVSTSQACHLAPPHPARLVGATGRLHPSQYPFPGYPWIMRGFPLGKGYMPLLLGRTRKLGCPLTVPLWWEVTWGPSAVSTPSESLWCVVT